jgi:hydroxymethylpyrimidine/phosphomethylpyrimidine kinase
VSAARVPFALSIAGSDSSGGAGIQADLKTFMALGVHGATVITAVTAQNTQGVHAIHAVPPEIVAAQLAAVFSDLDIRAVKIGMLPTAECVAAVAGALRTWRPAFVVTDPVMTATSGVTLMRADAAASYRAELLPLTGCLTPNADEAAALLGARPATSEADMAAQGRALLELGPKAVLMKGGHVALAEAVDLLVTRNGVLRLAGPRIETVNSHGTGCTLSAAIAALIVRGLSLPEAVPQAKSYLTAALKSATGLAFGADGGHGPIDHLHTIRLDD